MRAVWPWLQVASVVIVPSLLLLWLGRTGWLVGLLVGLLACLGATWYATRGDGDQPRQFARVFGYTLGYLAVLVVVVIALELAGLPLGR